MFTQYKIKKSTQFDNLIYPLITFQRLNDKEYKIILH